MIILHFDRDPAGLIRRPVGKLFQFTLRGLLLNTAGLCVVAAVAAALVRPYYTPAAFRKAAFERRINGIGVHPGSATPFVTSLENMKSLLTGCVESVTLQDQDGVSSLLAETNRRAARISLEGGNWRIWFQGRPEEARPAEGLTTFDDRSAFATVYNWLSEDDR